MRVEKSLDGAHLAWPVLLVQDKRCLAQWQVEQRARDGRSRLS